MIKRIGYNKDLPDCYIFDIDGTLAIKGDRSPYDWDRVGEDKPNASVIVLYNFLWEALKKTDIRFFIMSGRDSVCNELTLTWLSEHLEGHNGIYMRPQGDNRKDTIVKKEMYDNHVKGKYNVLGIFDDRLSVCRMWHSLGLPLFRVGDPDADF